MGVSLRRNRMVDTWELCTLSVVTISFENETSSEHFKIEEYAQKHFGWSPSISERISKEIGTPMYKKAYELCIQKILADGWEPFAVTENFKYFKRKMRK